MIKMFVSFICLTLMIVLGGYSYACDNNFVVHKPGTEACTVSDNGYYFNTIQDAVDAIKSEVPPGIPAPNRNIIVCPGTYVENVDINYAAASTYRPHLTFKSYSQNPADTIIQAADPNKDVLFVRSPGTVGISIKGFTLTGATKSAPCLNAMYSPYSTQNETPVQPCAGLRVYCTSYLTISNNIITGNYNGIIIKDTAPGWEFYSYIENNRIYGNLNAGVHLRYGAYNTIRNNNKIYDNPIGISLVDTWTNEIYGNNVENNDTGVSLGTQYYSYLFDNYTFNNNFINNTTQAYDASPGWNYWYENYWSPSPAPSVDSDPLASVFPVSDDDIDGDSIPNIQDKCQREYSTDQTDSDSDGVGDICDNCNYTANPDQSDLDFDGIGNACDPDKDGDGQIAVELGGTDCNDNKSWISPIKFEISLNGINDDCDSSTPDNVPIDLYIARLKVHETPTVAGQTVSISSIIGNAGPGISPLTYTQYYLSSDNMLDAGDTLLKEVSIMSIVPERPLYSGSVKLTIPPDTAANNYYIIASADATGLVAESSETNNNLADPIAVISASVAGSDLFIPVMTHPLVMVPSEQFYVGVNTYNNGSATAAASTTQLYLSTDTVCCVGDTYLGSVSIPSLPANVASPSIIWSTIPSNVSGTYYFIAMVDVNNTVAEDDENNNTTVSAAVTTSLVNLTVTSLTAPASATKGQIINVSDTTGNIGASASEPSITRYYLSTDSVYDRNDVFIGKRTVPSLAGGASNSGSASATIPTGTASGAYYIIVKANADNIIKETDSILDEEYRNNTFSRTITIN